jgi:hypothetical protein
MYFLDAFVIIQMFDDLICCCKAAAELPSSGFRFWMQFASGGLSFTVKVLILSLHFSMDY